LIVWKISGTASATAHCLNAIANAFLPYTEGEDVTNKADYRRLKLRK
jgi:hypothetical protein